MTVIVTCWTDGCRETFEVTPDQARRGWTYCPGHSVLRQLTWLPADAVRVV